jgi:tetratricopeptide (TPR) repeat protein
MSAKIALVVMLAGYAAAVSAAAPPSHPESLGDTLAAEIRDLEARLAARPADTGALRALAVAWRRHARVTGEAKSDAQAWSALERALRAEPSGPELFALKAWIQAARHDFEGAVESARAALLLRPHDADAHGVLADALTELGRYTDALAAVETMMRLRPNAAAYSRAAHQRALRGDREGAIAAMQLALESSNPGDPEAVAWCQVMLGAEHAALGRHREAQAHYRQALLRLPDYHLALFHLASSQAAAGSTRDALDTAERLQRLAPSVAVYALLGELHLAAGDVVSAERLFAEVDRIAATRDPSQAEPRFLARFYADRGRRLEEAIALVSAELETHQDIETWDGLAWALHRAGRHDEALAAARKAAALGTLDARLLLHHGLIEIALDRRSEGEARVARALALGNLWPSERRLAEAALAARVARK